MSCFDIMSYFKKEFVLLWPIVILEKRDCPSVTYCHHEERVYPVVVYCHTWRMSLPCCGLLSYLKKDLFCCVLLAYMEKYLSCCDLLSYLKKEFVLRWPIVLLGVKFVLFFLPIIVH